MAKILCTGGTGYIGSHTAIHLIENGYDVHLLDNLSNSDIEVLNRLEKITGKKQVFHKIDLRDRDELLKLFVKEKYDAVIHFAGLKAVGESCSKPLEYYNNNVVGSINLLEIMKETNCKVLVFSSSATVYQDSEKLLDEDAPLGPSNPYGQTKLMIENILIDTQKAHPEFKFSILRYFNPVGAHISGTIGESPEHPNNLLPRVQVVAVGRKECIEIYGKDWPTRDGTGVRDYIHISDLANGHVNALKKLLSSPSKNTPDIYNLGGGIGTSVCELIDAFENASGVSIKKVFTGRRVGDLASVVANPQKANIELQWKTQYTIHDACLSAWKWQSNNPYGYLKKT